MKTATLALGITLLCASNAQAANLVLVDTLDDGAACDSTPISSALVGIDGACTPTVDGSTKADCAAGTFETFSDNACAVSDSEQNVCTEANPSTLVLDCGEVDEYLVFTGTVGTCAEAGEKDVVQYLELGCRSYIDGQSTMVSVEEDVVTIATYAGSITCETEPVTEDTYTLGECTEDYITNVAGEFSLVEPPATAPPTAAATNASTNGTSNETGNATVPPTSPPTSGASLTSMALSGSMAVISALAALAVF